MLDRPVHGRLFFEQVIRENLDLGRPQEVRLIFNRTITRRTYERGPQTEAALLPEAVPGPSVPDLKNNDHEDGRHHDRSGQYRQYRKHFCSPERQCP